MNRSSLLAVVCALSLASSALADDRVLILPFNSLNVPAPQQWIAQAVQENLVADLGRTPGIIPIASGSQVIIEDNATAARLARNANAPYAVRGAAQLVGDDVRLTAQLIDSRTGDTLRTALVTGKAADLLKLEDQLASQIRGTDTAASTPTPAAAPPTIIVPSAPNVIVVSQPQPAYYPVYYPDNYYASYPYTSYSYPYSNYGYVPLLYPVNTGHRDRDPRDRDGRGTHTGNGSGGGGQIVHNNFNPAGLPIPSGGNLLPIPTGNVLPIPSGNLLPIPTSSFQPIPTRNVSPIPANNLVPVINHMGPPVPTVSPTLPTHNAGTNRNPKMVN